MFVLKYIEVIEIVLHPPAIDREVGEEDNIRWKEIR